MARGEPDEDDDLDDILDNTPSPRSSRPSGRGRARRDSTSRPPSLRRWGDSEEPDDPDDLEDDTQPRRKKRSPVFWRARDSLYFEPLVALAVLALLLVSLYAYTSNWPPVYVVESNSMQHGAGDRLGVLNAGDIVLAEKIPNGSIVTYVQGIKNGFQTYGERGDVLIYDPNGTGGATPIIHRAILFLQWNPHNSTYNASQLSGLACGSAPNAVYAASGAKPCQTVGFTQADDLTLYNIGGRTVSIDFSRTTDLGSHSGFLTMGDNNSAADQLPASDSGLLSTLVEPGWVVGVARGLIPWFGALKLLLDGNSGKVPTASWEFLGLTIAGVILAAAGLHYLFRREGLESPLRRREEEEASEDGEEPPPKTPRRRAAVRAWRDETEPDEEEEPEAEPAPTRPRRLSYEERRRSHFTSTRERRAARARRASSPEKDDSDAP